MNRNTPLVSFVVLSWNTLEDTKACLKNIREQNYDNKEIVVVDNGSNDGSKDYLARVKDIVYIDLPKNTGFTGGQIAALDKCNGDYILLLNSDAVLDANWTVKALEVFKADQKIAAVGGKVFEWNDSHEVFDVTSPFYSYQKVDTNLGYASTLRTGETRVDVDSISGAAVMIARKAIDEVGYFDNTFFAYFEETDLFARYQRHGYKIIYEPTLHAWHQIAKSSKGQPYFYLYHMHRNRFMFAYKNFDHPWRFFLEYTVDYLRAKKRYKRSEGMDEKARIKAYRWNLRHLGSTIRKRREIGGDESYTKILSSRRPGDDVTVIIPSYNYADYLPEAIESVLNQTVKAHRIIVIDDGSSDESVNIAKSYKEIEVVAKENEGVIATKNLGIQMSSTSWTLFLDADDILQSNYIEHLLKEARKQNADVIYCDMEYIGSKTGVFRSIEFSIDKLTEGNFIHNSSLINTTLLKNIGGFKPEMHGGYEDWELYLTLAETGSRFAYCRDTFLQYRQHDGALGRNNSATENADTLLEHAKSLHPQLYQSAYRNKQKGVKVMRMLLKHPELPFICLALIPISVVMALKDYARGMARRIIRGTRTYIHYREK